MKTIKKGDRGNEVAILQKKLGVLWAEDRSGVKRISADTWA